MKQSGGVKANNRMSFVARPALLPPRAPVLPVPWRRLSCAVRVYDTALIEGNLPQEALSPEALKKLTELNGRP